MCSVIDFLAQIQKKSKNKKRELSETVTKENLGIPVVLR